MGAGVRDLAPNVALRDHLWRGLVPFDRPPPAARPELADVDPAEAAERLRRARLIDRELAEAIASGSRDAIAGADRARPILPRGTGLTQSLFVRNVSGGAAGFIAFGPFTEPYWIREIAISGQNIAAVGLSGRVEFALLLAGAEEPITGPYATATRIWPTDLGDVAEAEVLQLNGTQSITIRFLPNTLVADTGRFLVARQVNTPAPGGVVSTAVVVIEEATGVSSGLVAPPLDLASLGRRYVGGSRPPAPRQPGRALPVGFTFQVMQAGRILFSRTVPFSSSTAREAGYNPVTGGAAPNVVVHHSEQSWSNAFELERQRRTF